MQLSPSAYADTFCRDNLPPPDQWPELEFTLPELQYPDRLNAADELLNPTLAAGGADRPCLISPEQTWSYGEVAARSARIARVLTEDLGLVPGNRVLLRGAEQPLAGRVLAGRAQGRRCRGRHHADAARGRAHHDRPRSPRSGWRCATTGSLPNWPAPRCRGCGGHLRRPGRR